MALYANFNSPQFVDFLSNDTFDINDGADHLFEEYFVGEGTRRVRSEEGIPDGHDRFLADLKNLSLKNNHHHHQQQQEHSKANTTTPRSSNSNHGSVENKENTANAQGNVDVQEKEKEKPDIVGTTGPGVGSALDLMNIAASAIAPVVRPPLIKTSSIDVTNSNTNNHYPKQRTMSNTVVMSTPLLSNKPSQAPAHNGVVWIPKIGGKKQQVSNETESEKKSASEATASAVNVNPTKPIIAGGGHDNENNKKPVIASSGLSRATPGKSASMRGEKKPNLIKSLLMKPKQIPLASKPPMPHHTHDSHHSTQAEKKTTSSSNLASKAHNTSGNNSQMSANSSHIRKVSESKIPLGFLHTELRAQKRHEFDAIIKEKERLAAEQRMMHEQEKQRQEQEMIQNLRSQLTFKSKPIRHYRPVEIKPSDRPLTSPKSPHLGSLLKNENHLTIKKVSSSSLNASQEDVRV